MIQLKSARELDLMALGGKILGATIQHVLTSLDADMADMMVPTR